MKDIIIFFLKITVAAGLLYWLVSSGKLDFSQTKIILETWQFFIFLLLPALFFTMFLQNLRWWILIQFFKLTIPLRQAFLFTWIGNFFSSILPGLVSGDIIKGAYFYNLKKSSLQKFDLVSIYATLFIDRLLGLFGLLIIFLFSMAIIVVEQKKLAYSLFPFVLISIAILFCFFLFIFYPSKDKKRWLEKIIQKMPKQVFFMKVYQNFRVLRKHKWKLLGLIFISLVIHIVVCLLFYQITTFLIVGSSLTFWKQMALIPLGMIATAIPISPAGIGVGHVAFENLYSLFGVNGGANIFNLFIIPQIFVYLLGCIPFLLYRKKTNKRATE